MTEEELLERIKSGKLIEGPEYATDKYIAGLRRTLIVSGETELISAPASMRAARRISSAGTPQIASAHSGVHSSRLPRYSANPSVRSATNC